MSYRIHGDPRFCMAISNKEKLAPQKYKGDPVITAAGWDRGYSFNRFWGNCHFLLGEIASLDGVQQLVHQYYLKNGSLGSIITTNRIKKFLGETHEH